MGEADESATPQPEDSYMAEQYDAVYEEQQGYQAYEEPQQGGPDDSFGYFTATAPPLKTTVIKNFTCQVCNASFPSNNQCFKHIKDKRHFLLKSTIKKDPLYMIAFDESFNVLASANLLEKVFIVPSFGVGSRIEYYSFSYFTVQVQLKKDRIL